MSLSFYARLRQSLTGHIGWCVLTGFTSGLPLFLLFQLLPAWLRSAGVDLKTIGLMALVQIPYTLKFLWAPLIDRYAIPGGGRRRGWIAVMTLLTLVVIAALGSFAPKHDMAVIALMSLLIAWFSATLDIAIDAFRRELLTDSEQGFGNGVHIAAYRVAGLVPGSLSLILADHLPWSQVFVITALFLIPGLALALLAPEPTTATPPSNLHQAVVKPFVEFIERKGWLSAIWVLLFLFFYKLGDSLCTSLATPFYLDMGFSLTHIGFVAKNAGLWSAVLGGILGGALTHRWGIAKALWLFGVVQALSILGFAWLAVLGPYPQVGSVELIALALVIAFEAIGVGLGSAAFVAFIALQTHSTYTATQFALFTSLTAVPRTLVSASAGWLVDKLGWSWFFVLCFVLAIPGMLLLFKVAPWPRLPASVGRGDDAGS